MIDGYQPGCLREDCVCQTPPRICPEYLLDYRDEHCVRCGWTEVKHITSDIYSDLLPDAHFKGAEIAGRAFGALEA